MSANLIAKSAIAISAPASRVWEALTTPEEIKQYLYGAEAVSEWKVGSPLLFKGVWDGKEYIDKGTILRSEPNKLFQYSYYSPSSGLPDSPENYANISYELVEEDGETMLTVKQENVSDEQTRERAQKNWEQVLQSLKNITEK
jgi:uncharacterized protein YndB with AHSA1/START domain